MSTSTAPAKPAISARKLAANRTNARKSTGPQTPDDKAISSQNATTHGLRSCLVLLPDEDPAPYHQLHQQLLQDLQPQGALQHLLVERICANTWRLRRAGLIEAGLFTRPTPSPGDTSEPTPLPKYLFYRFKYACESADALGKLARYENTLSRGLQSALQQLLKLQTQHLAPNEPTAPTDPTAPTAPAEPNEPNEPNPASAPNEPTEPDAPHEASAPNEPTEAPAPPPQSEISNLKSPTPPAPNEPTPSHAIPHSPSSPTPKAPQPDGAAKEPAAVAPLHKTEPQALSTEHPALSTEHSPSLLAVDVPQRPAAFAGRLSPHAMDSMVHGGNLGTGGGNEPRRRDPGAAG